MINKVIMDTKTIILGTSQTMINKVIMDIISGIFQTMTSKNVVQGRKQYPFITNNCTTFKTKVTMVNQGRAG